jgi:hypothetical protein
MGMKLQLSDRDRVIAAMALKNTAWGGGEDRMLALHGLCKALDVEGLEAKFGETSIERVGRSPATLTMPHELVELLVEVLGGGNQGFKAEFGRLFAELLARVRAQKPKKEATKP